jgi:outer membrane protein assembly factor BamB
MARAILLLLCVLGCFGAGCSASSTDADPAPTASPAAVSEWPMYGRDPARSSRNPFETALTVGQVPALAARWQARVGLGPLPPSCSPAVAGGRVFACSSRTDGDNFFAFDAKTGALLWSADLGRPGAGSVGIGASPAVAGGIVVAGGADGAYYALDAATGALRWRHALDSGRNDFAWASPLVSGSHVWIGVSSEGEPPGRGEVRLLDLDTGTLLASVLIVPDGQQGGDVWNSPALSPDSSTLVVATGNDFGGFDGPLTRAVVALDPMTLNVVASRQEAFADLDLDFGTTPVVLAIGGRTMAAALNKNGILYAYDLARLAAGPVWQRQEGLAIGLPPAFDGKSGTLWFAGDNGQLFAVDAQTGANRFEPAAVGFMNGNLALAGDLVFAPSGGGVTVVEAATGKILRILEPEGAGPSYSGVAVAAGRIYWLSGEYLNVWGPS